MYNNSLINYNRGTNYLLAGKYAKALQFLKRETLECKELHLNLGNVYRRLGEFGKSEQSYIRATRPELLDLDGSGGLYAPALCNLGLLAYGAGNDLEAITFYKAALEINPLIYDAIWNCSTALLRQWCSGGSLNKDAWAMYDYRFKAIKPITGQFAHWDGGSGSSILVLAEQGLGDKIQFGRYFSLLREKFDRVILQLPKILWPLFPSFECIEDYKDLEVSCSIPVACLPSIYGFGESGYLSHYNVQTVGKLKVGIEWLGSATHLNDKYRSCSARYIATLVSKFPSVEFYNFRPDSKPVKGVTKVVTADFGETAVALGGMDLLISVDTSIVHLAGSMNLDTWMMQPTRETDFRWGLPAAKREYGMDVEKNMWYPSVAVLENKGWDLMFKEIELRLSALSVKH